MARTPELLCADVRDELAKIARLELDDFRGFRHVFRNCYSFELDWERERLVASRFRRAAALLHVQVNAFLGQIEGLAP
jgi:hypothetical protein